MPYNNQSQWHLTYVKLWFMCNTVISLLTLKARRYFSQLLNNFFIQYIMVQQYQYHGEIIFFFLHKFLNQNIWTFSVFGVRILHLRYWCSSFTLKLPLFTT